MNSEDFAKVVEAYVTSKEQPRLVNPTFEHQAAMNDECRWRIAKELQGDQPDRIVFLPCLVDPYLWPENEGKGFFLKCMWGRHDHETYCYSIERRK
jgi:hypothetical protein